ncbi:right-handed parallel beta-helix repeat-containing protein [Chitinophaga filiformis]|uniref:Right-handed parallel beta-helix repeat-containing protein n=1 Tax=Chitinophaga filiformis TaxID=104663 RepID=A0ABY4IA83_CHIFI|nr:right-handed parallel beta-helix repeat-containing protein [Chitinophaga filiformis]UPK72264.1 right-handed parallel beta-helix repeat-containing protein [Chitinophaga filiformis]
MKPLFLVASCAIVLTSCSKNLEQLDNNENLAAGPAIAVQDYFVSPTGSDNNDGKSPEKAFKTIQKAANLAKPGTTVHLAGGIYQQQLEINVSGTAEQPITFSGSPDAPAYIQKGGANSAIVTIANQSHIRLYGLNVGKVTKKDAQGILITATSTGTVTDIELNHVNVSEVAWTTTPTQTPGDNDNAQGIIVYGEGKTQANAVSNIRIDSCKVFNNITGYSEAISLDGNIDGFRITHCEVYNNTNIGIALIGNYRVSSTASLDQARNGVVSQNNCYNNVADYATSGGIYVDGARDIKIERNWCKGNGYGIEVGAEENGSASNITVVANVLQENREAGLALGGYNSETSGQVLNATIINNTFYRNSVNASTGEIAMTKASNCVVSNNIFYTNAKLLFYVESITPQQNNRFDYNTWFTPTGTVSVQWAGKSYSSFATYQTGAKQDAHSINKDPLFVSTSDFHLQSGSPSRNIADVTAIKDATQLDKDGLPLVKNNVSSMGAYQQ